jgi:hypothetical protein
MLERELALSEGSLAPFQCQVSGVVTYFGALAVHLWPLALRRRSEIDRLLDEHSKELEI